MTAVQSVERAFAIVGCLASGTSGVSEIADRVALPKSTVARLLTTLVELGVAEQPEPGGRYRLGSYLHELAAQATPVRSLVASGRPHLVELVNAVGESAGLSVLDGDDVLYLDQVSAGADVQVRDWTGTRLKPHVVSSGLVLLAWASSDRVASVLADPLPQYTDRSIITPDAIVERLDQVRSDGIAWVVDELSPGLSSVAAPVFDRNGAVIAAVHVHGPSFRFPGSNTKTVSSRVKSAADRIASSLKTHDR
jgi:IclR family transcriptional regulator, acetate operon repressor